jgi:LysR family transcriptional regulator, transcriptional activator of nhaA
MPKPLNYKHLHYFWMVSRSGGVAQAGERLAVTPQSISTQMRQLETAVGDTLWRRAGRKLELTETGSLVLEYADRMFRTGEELSEALRHRPDAGITHFRVGIADMVPKILAHRLIAPALALERPPRLSCKEGRFSDLLAQLAVHRLDMVISDRPMPSSLDVRGYNHLLLESGVSFLGVPALARKLRPGFPHSLDGAPLLLPGEDASIRKRLLAWFDRLQIAPRVVAEFDDTALMKAFGQAGTGVFALPSLTAEAVSAQLRTPVIGTTRDLVERYYAVTAERRIRHPAIVAISEAAKAVAP